MARLSEHGIRLSSMSPSFLNSNSTSHTWPFSAVAELIDNASDPGVSAKQIWIDVVEEGDQLCLTFTDNGSGMTPNKLHKMLSFGFTEKGSGRSSHPAIGVYGNGFKSGSMRLGRDALIFTKNGGCQSVGMLSQSYLQVIKAQAVIVPIVPFNQQTKSMVVTEDSEASLAAILKHSIINSKEQIHTHFDSIPCKKGTKILIWNIRRARDGNTEIDFETDPSDFRLPEIQTEELKKGLRNSGSLRPEQNIPDMYYSLRAYVNILYLKPRTQVILRGKKILAKLVSKTLAHIEHDVYKPQFSKEKFKVTFGLNPKKKDNYGIMMYHNNRLIKAYEKVGCQLKVSGQRAGIGVIGVIECNFLKPAHNKQDFEYTKEYRLTLGALGLKLNDYWKVVEKKAKERESQPLDKDNSQVQQEADAGPMWLQCEDCLKWRNIPANHYTVTPESWNCSMNPNPRYRSCSTPEDAEESREQLTPSYQKTHKKLEPSRSRTRQKSSEMCHFQKKGTRHQDSSPSSSECQQDTSQSMDTPDQPDSPMDCYIEDTLACSDTNTNHHEDAEPHSTMQSASQYNCLQRDTVIKEKKEAIQVRKVMENVQIFQDTNGDRKKDTHAKEHIDTLSLKRKIETVLYSRMKKQYMLAEKQPASGNIDEELHPGKQANTSKTVSSIQDALQQTATNHNWTHVLPETQTGMVSPVSRMEGRDQEATVQRLAALEEEVTRLRARLGLEVKKRTQGTMTTADSSNERVTSSTASREVSCQADMDKCSASASAPSQAGGLQGLLVQDQSDQSEQNKPRRERTAGQSRMRVSDGELCDNSQSEQQILCDIRSNVVVLLTSLLPQLDLTGISVETADIDNILQQIIEVNSMKL
ncbi:MORC family CW-type zinc finger protein 3 [Cololabis saira]|uniref:MORC family CW-type zinc finger protein 3 n=1 Tax=Cololabis saira TaxID=129043 RepID=UPI002AD5648A|nr:MORC family CW-type zinc finger protein 3 [Cololabis saira]